MAEPTSASSRPGTHCTAIHSLPEELLSLVFVHTLLSDSDARYPLSTDSQPTTAYIARTCTLWRSIALRTPALWTRVHYYWPTDIFQLYIKRSEMLPLTLYIVESSLMFSSRLEDITLLSPKLEHARARMQHLHFRASPTPALIGQEGRPQTTHFIPLGILFTGYFPTITTLTVAVDRTLVPPQPSNLLDHVALPLVITPPLIVPSLPSGEMKNIRSLSMLNVDFHLVHDMLARFGELPHLVELELEGIRGPRERQPDAEKIELAALKKLKLKLEPKGAMVFLTAVETPRVTDMEFALLDGEEMADLRINGDKWQGADNLLLGAKAQMATIKQAAFDAVELSASSDEIRVEFSGSEHRLKLVLPGIAASDISTIVPLLPIPSSSQLLHLILHTPFSSDAHLVSSLIALPALKNVHTISVYAPASALQLVNTLEGVPSVKKLQVYDCEPDDWAALRKQEGSETEVGRRLQVEIMSLSEGIISKWGT